MREATTALLLYVAVALLYGASRVRNHARLPLLESPRRSLAARVLASGAVVGSGWLWREVESGTAAALVVLVVLMVMGTLVTLLGPLVPRAIWGGALLAAVAAPLLAILGGSS